MGKRRRSEAPVRNMHLVLRYRIAASKSRKAAHPTCVQEEHLDGEGVDAEDAGRRLVDGFNDTLRPGEHPRVFVSAEPFPGDDRPRKHDWEKVNLVTLEERRGCCGSRTYDRMECTRCGVTGRRYGVGPCVRLDRRHAKWENCNEAMDRKRRRKR